MLIGKLIFDILLGTRPCGNWPHPYLKSRQLNSSIHLLSIQLSTLCTKHMMNWCVYLNDTSHAHAAMSSTCTHDATTSSTHIRVVTFLQFQYNSEGNTDNLATRLIRLYYILPCQQHKPKWTLMDLVVNTYIHVS